MNKIKLKKHSYDPDMIEISDTKLPIVWAVVHRDVIYDDTLIREALDKGLEVICTITVDKVSKP